VLPASRTRILSLAIALLLVVRLAGGASAALVEAHRVHQLLDFPSTLKFAPDGRLFYLETFAGNVMYYADSNAMAPTLWASIPVISTVEHGLLGMAFHPQFPDSPYVYFYHTNPTPYFNRVVRMTDSSGVGTHYCVIFDGLPCGSESHEGGRLAFGPDRMLYVTVGDQGVEANSQDTSTPLGKILRLTTMGLPAPGNPFGPLNPAIAYGTRNSYGICFDPLNGDGYFTENGPTCDDELNFLQFAANYGWGPNHVCGVIPPGTMAPMWSISPTIAPTGICVYRGKTLQPYNGDLFFTSFNQSNLWRVVLSPAGPDQVGSVQVFSEFDEAALDVTVGPDQSIWVSTASSIWRIAPSLLATDDRTAPLANWRPGPSPFTNHITLAPRDGERLRRIDVLDVSGRRVRTFTGPFSATAGWDGHDESGRSLPAGVYLMRGELFSGRQIMRNVVRLAR